MSASTITIVTLVMLMLIMHAEPLMLGQMSMRKVVAARRCDVDGLQLHHFLFAPQQIGALTTTSLSSIPEEFEPTSSSSISASPFDPTTTRRGRLIYGDKLRESTGIRPSIHPTVINCISEALLLRSQNILGNRDNSYVAIDVGDRKTKPLDIAITAGNIASSAIEKRSNAAKSGYEVMFQKNSNLDETKYDHADEHIYEATSTTSTDDTFNLQESKLICGRVVGVVMRLRDLEEALVNHVMSSSWVQKYREEGSFGLLKEECDAKGVEPNEKLSLDRLLAEKIVHDPLIRMNRAECLLALFLYTVERPALEKMSSLDEEAASLVETSNVDFIDADRLEVLKIV